MSEPKPLTPDELRDYLLGEMWERLHYWRKQPDISCREQMEGLVFSILVVLDGMVVGSPCSFDLVASSGSEAKQDATDNEERTYVEDGTVISDMLHEHWFEHPARKRL
jgi:hypothetical protein